MSDADQPSLDDVMAVTVQQNPRLVLRFARSALLTVLGRY